jgi:FkbM family methyltransferase
VSLVSLFAHVTRHPLNQGGRTRAVARVLRWQLVSRLGTGPIALPFVNDTRLLLRSGMSGATGNWYCGLHEPHDMGFALHFLRADDCFFDVGANVGSYTILAAGAAGARVIAVEPIRATYEALRANVQLNGLDDAVTLLNVGIGAADGTAWFTSHLDAMNRMLAREEKSGAAVEVPIVTLDGIAAAEGPTFLKIDVEGAETAVLAGGATTMRSDSLRCVLIEMNGSGTRFGADDAEIHRQMRNCGFFPVCYDALARSLTALPVDTWNRDGGNTLYIRDIDECRQRVRSAGRFRLVNREI